MPPAATVGPSPGIAVTMQERNESAIVGSLSASAAGAGKRHVQVPPSASLKSGLALRLASAPAFGAKTVWSASTSKFNAPICAPEGVLFFSTTATSRSVAPGPM